MKYRKKPVVINAILNTNLTNTLEWLGEFEHEPDAFSTHGPNIDISTLEGVMTCRHGDYLIRGVKGEFYPCKPDIFEQTYEPVE